MCGGGGSSDPDYAQPQGFNVGDTTVFGAGSQGQAQADLTAANNLAAANSNTLSGASGGSGGAAPDPNIGASDSGNTGGSQAPVAPVQAPSQGVNFTVGGPLGIDTSGTPTTGVGGATPGGVNSNIGGTNIAALAAPSAVGGVQDISSAVGGMPAAAPISFLNAPTGGAPGGAAAVGGGVGSAAAGAQPVDFTSQIDQSGTQLDKSTQNSAGTDVNAPAAPAPKATANTGGFDLTKLLGPAISAGGLIYAAQQQKQQGAGLPSAGQSGAQISQAASSLGQQAATTNANAQPILSQGQVLTDYLNNGKLPDTIQAQLDQQIKSQKAQIISGYASRGQNTDPTQNSTLAQELAGVDNNAQVTKGQLETQLFSAGQQMVQTANTMFAQGASDTQVQAQLLNMSASIDQNLTAQTQKAIANFASSLGTAAGGTKSPTIQIGGTSVQST